MLKKCLLVAALAVVALPGVARADFLFTPYAGMTFGKDASDHEHGMYGVSFNWMGAGIAGLEIDFGYSPNFFEDKDCTTCSTFTGKNNVIDLMFNGVIGVPIGGQKGLGVRPYGLIGVGLLRQSVPGATDLLKVSTNDFGFDIGGGTYIFFSDHVGIRGDVRYLRSLQDNDSGTAGFPDFALGKFDFWRWTAGVTIR
jgi:opacity protein-like surface antigen